MSLRLRAIEDQSSEMLGRALHLDGQNVKMPMRLEERPGSSPHLALTAGRKRPVTAEAQAAPDAWEAQFLADHPRTAAALAAQGKRQGWGRPRELACNLSGYEVVGLLPSNHQTGDNVIPVRRRLVGDICAPWARRDSAVDNVAVAKRRNWAAIDEDVGPARVDALVTATVVTLGTARSLGLLRMLLSLRKLYQRMPVVVADAGWKTTLAARPIECEAAQQLTLVPFVQWLRVSAPSQLQPNPWLGC